MAVATAALWPLPDCGRCCARDYYEQKKILHEYSEMKDDKPTADETPTSDGRSDVVPREADKNKRRRNTKGFPIRRKGRLGNRPHATISTIINQGGQSNQGSASRSSYESDGEGTSDDAEAQGSIVSSESGKGHDPMPTEAMDKNTSEAGKEADADDEDSSDDEQHRAHARMRNPPS